jgi:carbamoyltransferase
MLILGLSPFRHQPSAALLQDGTLKAAVENEKVSRLRSPGLPSDAIQFCLDAVGAKWADLETIAIATQPIRAYRLRSWSRARHFIRTPLASVYREAKEIGALARELKDLRILRYWDGLKCDCLYFDHHVCHSASAFLLSPYDRSLIITMDQGGDGHSGMIALGTGKEIEILKKFSFQDSPSGIYSQVTALIGFVPQNEEQKTQWLSLEGEAKHKSVFLEMLRKQAPMPQLDHSFVNQDYAKRKFFSGKFFEKTGLPSDPKQLNDDEKRDLASSIQEATAEVVTEMAEQLCKKHKVTEVCLAGGLFQNPLLVASIEKQMGRQHVFVPPSPGNAGTAVGAALLAWHNIFEKPRGPAVSHVYLGPRCNGQKVKDVLDNCKARYSVEVTQERKLDTAIELLMAGKIVGWVQGACEFGPRALGNRSVIASPWAPYVRENLNDYIKFREWFRPFAISVTDEDCERYFDGSSSCRFMNSLGLVRTNCEILPQEFVLPGGRVRIHIVERQANPQFWNLLKRFGTQAPAPMLVNTSFNLFGDPLVANPRDAIRGYFCSGIDALVIDNFVLSKGHITAGAQHWRERYADRRT